MSRTILMTYETSLIFRYFLKLIYGGVSVTVRDTPGKTDEFEIVDEQLKTLHFRRCLHEPRDQVWSDIVSKAHHVVLSRHAVVQAQEALDERMLHLYQEMQEKLHSLNHLNEVISSKSRTSQEVADMEKAVGLVSDAYDLLDDIFDPPAYAGRNGETTI